MIKQPIKVIFFDAAETLFRTRGSVGEIYLKLAKKYGSKAARGAIDHAFINDQKMISADPIQKKIQLLNGR
jgi:FMN phosphatase YigB (HAD superfamily)